MIYLGNNLSCSEPNVELQCPALFHRVCAGHYHLDVQEMFKYLWSGRAGRPDHNANDLWFSVDIFMVFVCLDFGFAFLRPFRLGIAFILDFGAGSNLSMTMCHSLVFFLYRANLLTFHRVPLASASCCML